MGRLNVQFLGFGPLPTAANADYSTFSDADFLRILAWVQRTQSALINQMFNPSNTPGFVPTNAQLAQAWVQSFINQSINREQALNTPAPVPPAPVVIGP